MVNKPMMKMPEPHEVPSNVQLLVVPPGGVDDDHSPRLRDSEQLLANEKFEELLDLSLNASKEILSLKLSQSDPNYPRLMSTKQAIIASVFSTAAKTDETRLKRKTADNIDALLRLVKDQERLLDQGTIEGRVLPMPAAE